MTLSVFIAFHVYISEVQIPADMPLVLTLSGDDGRTMIYEYQEGVCLAVILLYCLLSLSNQNVW